MWSTVTEVYPVIAPLYAPVGQVLLVEPQVADVSERYSVERITGIVAYRRQMPLSTLHWVAKC